MYFLACGIAWKKCGTLHLAREREMKEMVVPYDYTDPGCISPVSGK